MARNHNEVLEDLKRVGIHGAETTNNADGTVTVRAVREEEVVATDPDGNLISYAERTVEGKPHTAATLADALELLLGAIK